MPPIMRSVGYPAGSRVGACRISVESLTLETATAGLLIHLLRHRWPSRLTDLRLSARVLLRPLVAVIVRLPQAIGFWEGWDSRFTCQFVESRVAGRYAQAQNRGVESADQSGHRRHRDWRTTPEAPLSGRRSVAATATLQSAPR
jgi:hypothetical protein